MNLGYSFSAIFAMILVIFTGRRFETSGLKVLGDHKFSGVTIFIAIYCALDALWGFCYGGLINSPIAFTVISYLVYFMAGAVTLIWAHYIVDYMGGRDEARSILKTIAVVLMVIQLLILISNFFTHELFYVNAEGEYFYYEGRSQLQILQAINYLAIFVYGVWKLFTYHKDFRNRILRHILLSIIPGIFGIGQILLFGVPMYSMGFAAAVYAILVYDMSPRFLNSMDRQYRKERMERLSIINGLAGNFLTIYSVDGETNGFVIYNRTNDESFLKKIDNSKLDYFKVAVEKGRRMIHEDDLEDFLMLMDKESIRKRFAAEPSFSKVFRIRFGNTYKYFEYRFTDNNIDGREIIIIGVYDVDKTYRKRLKDAQVLKTAKERQMALEEEAQLLDRAAHRDIMTGLYNRRAYEDYIEDCKGMPDGDDFVFVSIDLNGLKAVNDDLGHEAGDELIKAAAFCMKKALGDYGYIYRHGGDEFSAILHAPSDKIEKIFRGLDKELDNYEGKHISEVSASYGYATVEESGNIPIKEMEKIADQRMYVAKNHYYARKGVDRRGQQEAYNIIRKSYLKILKVNLKEDTFSTIYMGNSEAKEDKGFNESLSTWLYDFAEKGNVHPDDKARFMERLSLDAIRNHFENGLENIVIHYRRKSSDGYNNALLEIIPTEDYSHESQIVFLYVKNIY